jgi:Putative quorum-sensing-regulated virulence factor
MFDPRELKLLRLALCPGAARGEVETAAIKLVDSLRARGVKAEALSHPALAKRSCKSRLAKGDMRIPFGKFRGQPIRDVPMDYLEWVLASVEGYPRLIRAIQRYLRSQEVAA